MPEPEEIEFARLLDWVEGRLPEEEARAVEEQVAKADDETRATVAWLRAFVRVSEDTVIASPPPGSRKPLVEHFEAYAEGKSRPGIFKRLVATLTFDGGFEPAFGVRSVGAQEAQRQLVYSTDAADIVFDVTPRPGDEGFDVDGQVFPLDDAEPGSFAVQLLEGEAEIVMTATDELGQFAFGAVPPGAYEVFISGDRVEIRIPHLELRP